MSLYSALLATHSLVRWLVVISLLITIFRAYQGWLGNKPFTKLDNLLRHNTATILHVQLLIGVWLYFISPHVAYFLQKFSDAMQNREVRFFGMEHISMMLIGITIVTIGSAKAKRKTEDNLKFKTIAIWFTIGFLIILASIPWSFSPIVSRPDFRPF